MRNEFRIADIALAPEGHRRVEWAWEYMPVLKLIAEKEAANQPLAGVVVGTCLHLEAKTACLLKVLHQLGATVVTAGSNPLSTQDPICAALVEEGVHVFSRRGMSAEEYSDNIREMLKWDPQVIIDDGGDVVSMVIEERRDLIKNIMGGCEETTTGIKRLRAMANEGVLALPDARRQRRAEQAPFRQPLRHGPVRLGRDTAHDEPHSRGQERRRRGLRLVRQGDGETRGGPRRARHSRRGRPAQSARSAHGRLRGHEHERRGEARRRLRLRDRQHEGHPPRAF